MLVGLLRDEIADISDNLKAPDGAEKQKTLLAALPDEGVKHRASRGIARKAVEQSVRLEELTPQYRGSSHPPMVAVPCSSMDVARSTTVASGGSTTSIQHATRSRCR
jgi:hypothetical protein